MGRRGWGVLGDERIGSRAGRGMEMRERGGGKERG